MQMHLEVNNSGAWKRVMSFNEHWEEDVEASASHLLRMGDDLRVKMRIIAEGASAPRRLYTIQRGWYDWDARGAA